MTKVDENIQTAQNMLDGIVKRCYELEEENKKLKSEIENMKKVGRENIETLDRMSIELENYSKSFKRYRDFSKQELADSLYDMEQENKKLKEKLDVLEKAKFEVMAYINMCYPKTYMEAEKLQKMKEMFERIYNEKLYFLEKENNELKEEIGKLVMKH